MQKHLPVIATAAMLILAGCGRNPDELTARGRKLMEEKKYDAAILDFQKALQKKPEHGEAAYRLAQALIQSGKVEDGARALVRAAELQPERVEVNVELADLMLNYYVSNPRKPEALYDRLKTLTNRLLEKDPNSADGLRIRGFLALTDRQPGQAAADLEKALARKKGDARIILGLMQAYQDDGRSVDAEKLALPYTEHGGTEMEAVYDALYGYYVGRGKYGDAEQVYVRKVSNIPNNVSYRLQLALHYVRANQRSKGDKVLEAMIADPTNFPNARLDVSDFYYGLQDYELARQLLDEGLAKDGKRKGEYQRRIVQILSITGKAPEAEKLLSQMIQEFPQDLSLKTMQAELWIKTNQRGKLDSSVEALRQVLKEKPGNVDSRMLLSRALRTKGDQAGAIAELREVLKQNRGHWDARLALASLLNETTEYKEALSVCDGLLAENPEHARAQLLRSVALGGVGRIEDARAILNKLVAKNPSFLEAQLQIGLLDILEKKYKEADEIFRKFYRPGQGDLRPLNGMVESRLAQKQFDSAISALKDELNRSANPDPIRMVLASTYARIGRYDEAVSELQSLVKTQAQSPLLHQRLGEVYLMKADLGNASKSFKQATDLKQDWALAWTDLAYAYELMNKDGEAIAAYRRSISIQPNDPVASNNLAYLLAANGLNLEESLKLAEKVQQMLPGNPAIMDTVGLVYIKRGQVDSALQIFLNLTQKYPDNVLFLQHHGMALLAKGDKAGARKAFTKALGQKTTPRQEQEIKQLLAQAG